MSNILPKENSFNFRWTKTNASSINTSKLKLQSMLPEPLLLKPLSAFMINPFSEVPRTARDNCQVFWLNLKRFINYLSHIQLAPSFSLKHCFVGGPFMEPHLIKDC